jgi:hypothetical protein
MKNRLSVIFLFATTVLCQTNADAQNPIITDQFTADPSARVFNGRVYVYPSHDIRAPESFTRKDWFCMEDYHVFSSSNLTDWTDHGVIVSQDKVDWVNSASYSMWAPDCIERNGKYYFYFPANVKADHGRGFGIGVAVADNPTGPYTPQSEPIKNVHGIDPCVFIDKDGQAYIYYSMGRIFAAKLNDNMLELVSEPQVMEDLPKQGLIEGPFVFERKGIYYLTYPHVENKTERLEYATGDNPMGPFAMRGVIMDELPSGCWTNQPSIIEFNNQWYLFYHDNDLSPEFDKNRSARIDSLFFNADGTIRKVSPTFRGVGKTIASGQIETDRYSHISQKGVSVDFLDNLNRFKGWKTTLRGKDAWIQFNAVDFGRTKPNSVQVNVFSSGSTILQIRIDDANGPIISRLKIARSSGWNVVEGRVSRFLPGIHNLVLVSGSDTPVEVDWIRFK